MNAHACPRLPLKSLKHKNPKPLQAQVFASKGALAGQGKGCTGDTKEGSAMPRGAMRTNNLPSTNYKLSTS